MSNLSFFMLADGETIAAADSRTKTGAAISFRRGKDYWEWAYQDYWNIIADTNNYSITADEARDFYGETEPDIKLLAEIETRFENAQKKIEKLKGYAEYLEFCEGNKLKPALSKEEWWANRMNRREVLEAAEVEEKVHILLHGDIFAHASIDWELDGKGFGDRGYIITQNRKIYTYQRNRKPWLNEALRSYFYEKRHLNQKEYSKLKKSITYEDIKKLVGDDQPVRIIYEGGAE